MNAVPQNGNSFTIAVRRGVLFEKAAVALGGSAKLAAAIGLTRRAVTHKMCATRGLTDDDLKMTIEAIEAQRVKLAMIADDIRAVLA